MWAIRWPRIVEGIRASRRTYTDLSPRWHTYTERTTKPDQANSQLQRTSEADAGLEHSKELAEKQDGREQDSTVSCGVLGRLRCRRLPRHRVQAVAPIECYRLEARILSRINVFPGHAELLPSEVTRAQGVVMVMIGPHVNTRRPVGLDDLFRVPQLRTDVIKLTRHRLVRMQVVPDWPLIELVMHNCGMGPMFGEFVADDIECITVVNQPEVDVVRHRGPRQTTRGLKVGRTHDAGAVVVQHDLPV